MAFLVPLVLLAVAVLLAASSHFASRRRAKSVAPVDDGPILVHSINDDRCVGCDACVAVCPTDVLELKSNKARVLRFGDCIQCEQCMWACPTQALVMHREDKEPPPLKMADLDPYYQTAVEGMYLIGEVAGKPLVKNAANAGRAVIEDMRRRGLRSRAGAGQNAVDVVIVGSGPAGLSAALTCIHHGLSYALIEKEPILAATIARYPKGKDVMVEPYDVKNVSFLPVYDSRKEELLPAWQDLVRRVGLRVRLAEAVESVNKVGPGAFTVQTSAATYVAQRVVLATGTRGRPRRLGVPGENLTKVVSLLEDPDAHAGQDVLVVGGGDSAVEAALALSAAGARVTLSYRGDSFSRAQARNREQIKACAAEGRVTLLLGSRVEKFGEVDVKLTLGDGKQVRLGNQAAFVLIGAEAPIAWLEKLGVSYTMRPHWYALPRTDEVVESLLGRLAESPRDPAACAQLVLARSAAPPRAQTVLPPPEPTQVSPAPRDRTRPHSIGDQATLVPRRARTRAKTHSAEDTRLLRMLRDEGARLADEDTGSIQIAPRRLGSPPAAPTLPPVPRPLLPPPPSRSGAYPAISAKPRARVSDFECETRVADDGVVNALREDSLHEDHEDVGAVLDEILSVRDDDTVQTHTVGGVSGDWSEDRTLIDPQQMARFG